jgi:hypothetical protein
MSTKTEIVVCRASYREVVSAIFRPVSFSTQPLSITLIDLGNGNCLSVQCCEEA